MEDSFRVRVDRTFGSLSSSSQPLSSSLWCLTDAEIEKRSWNRESDSPADDDEEDAGGGTFPSDVDRLFLAATGKLGVSEEKRNPNPNANPRDDLQELQDDLQELDEDSVQGTSGGAPSTSSQSREAVDDEEEELDVRNSIGMDCTLDFEEEEDVYDKVAVGRETTCDRLYMNDVTDYTPHLDSYNEIPNSFKEVSRDPRANHLAAMLRLKEDSEAARSFSSLHVSEQTVAVVSDAPNNKDDVESERSFNSLVVSEQTLPVVSDSQNNTSVDRKNLKSILKRKEDQMDSKSEKRVRFEPNCKTSDERESGGDGNREAETSNGENTPHGELSCQHLDPSLVPDYIRNPSRYTYYTFDSLTDMNEESNRLAYMDFLNMIKKSKQSEPEEVPADLSKPVIFNPKKKTTNNETTQTKEVTMEEPMLKKSLPVSFAFQNRPEYEGYEMEVDDEQETEALKVRNAKRAARQYRLKQSPDSDESGSISSH